MKYRNVILAAALLALSASIPAAFGQSELPTILNGGTNPVSANTTNTYTGATNGLAIPTFTLLHSRWMAVNATYALMGAGTSPATFALDASVDSANWTPSVMTFSVTAYGTNSVTGGTNFDTGGYIYWRVRSIINTNASTMTNVYVFGSTKFGL